MFNVLLLIFSLEQGRVWSWRPMKTHSHSRPAGSWSRISQQPFGAGALRGRSVFGRTAPLPEARRALSSTITVIPLRRLCVTHLLWEDDGIRTVHALSGHRNVSTTMLCQPPLMGSTVAAGASTSQRIDSDVVGRGVEESGIRLTIPAASVGGRRARTSLANYSIRF